MYSDLLSVTEIIVKYYFIETILCMDHRFLHQKTPGKVRRDEGPLFHESSPDSRMGY